LLLADQHEPREYQTRIAETASNSNTLVVLPTGLGKTLIAMLVASRRLARYPTGKILVLAPTRPLTLQHYNSFKKNVNLPPESFVVLTGTTTPKERAYLWDGAKLIFATPQTVYNDVRSQRVSLKDVVLVVFDEAHRCVKDYSYTSLAKLYSELGENPLILGLTASPGASKERVNAIKRNLFIDKVEARTEEDEDVKSYVEKTNIGAFKVKLPEEYQSTLLLLREIFGDKLKKLRNSGFLQTDRISKKALLDSRNSILARLKAAERNGEQKGYIFGAIVNQSQAVMVLHAVEVLETQGASTLAKYLQRLKEKPEQGRAASYLQKDPRWLSVEEETRKIKAVRHPKLDLLISTVKEQLGKKPDSKIIVFTQYRDTIEEIVNALSVAGLDGKRFVGQSDRSGSAGMDQRVQAEILEMFREGRFSVLVSSSIGEEGLHVPDVDLVVFYEAVPSEIRYIQRRGRTGRTTEGRVIILLSEGTVDESYYYSSLYKEKKMRSLVSEGKLKRPGRRSSRNPTLLDYVE
jgi:Fanconi anemia group M protein